MRVAAARCASTFNATAASIASKSQNADDRVVAKYARRNAIAERAKSAVRRPPYDSGGHSACTIGQLRRKAIASSTPCTVRREGISQTTACRDKNVGESVSL